MSCFTINIAQMVENPVWGFILWLARTSSYLLSLRNNRLKFIKTAGKLPIIVEEFYRIFPNLIKENWRMSTCNQLDLQTLGSQPVMPKNSPNHSFHLPTFLDHIKPRDTWNQSHRPWVNEFGHNIWWGRSPLEFEENFLLMIGICSTKHVVIVLLPSTVYIVH